MTESNDRATCAEIGRWFLSDAMNPGISSETLGDAAAAGDAAVKLRAMLRYLREENPAAGSILRTWIESFVTLLSDRRKHGAFIPMSCQRNTEEGLILAVGGVNTTDPRKAIAVIIRGLRYLAQDIEAVGPVGPIPADPQNN